MEIERTRLTRALCRWIVAVSCHALPPSARTEWKRHLTAEIDDWWLLVERASIPPVCRPILSFVARAAATAICRRLAPRSPSFAIGLLAAVLVLVAVGTGGFSGTRRLLRPLPYREASRIVQFRVFIPFEGVRSRMPQRLLEQWQKSTATVDAVGGYTIHGPVVHVTPRFFEEFGVDRAAWLRHLGVRSWAPISSELPSVLLARLKPGATAEQAHREWKEYASRVAMRPVTDAYRQPLSNAVWAVSAALIALTGAIAVLAIRRHWRYCAFLWVKTALVTLLYGAMWLEATQRWSPWVMRSGGPTAYLMAAWSLLLGAPLLLWWCIHDQRRRCPDCLFRLTRPISLGSWSSPLLDPAGTEFLCDRGHGTLYVPETLSSDREPEQWMPLHTSWRN